MVAVVRGRGFRGGKSRAHAPSRPAKPAPKPRAAGTGTSKLKVSTHSGVPPRIALIAALGAVVTCGAIILFTGGRLQAVGAASSDAFYSALGSIGFRMTSLQIAGASPFASRDIASATGLGKNAPILGLDLNAIRTRVQQVGWVESASVVRMLPGTIIVRVVERTPVAVWQVNGRMQVIDGKGRVITEADPGRFPQLPLVVGAGANTSGDAVYDLIKARPRLAQSLEALVRVNGRRWDLRLKEGAIIQLPATNVAEAMIRLDRLDQGQRLLDLGLERIDLRAPDMVVVRRRDAASPVPAAV